MTISIAITLIFAFSISFLIAGRFWISANKKNNGRGPKWFFLGDQSYGMAITISAIVASFVGGGALINQIQLSGTFGYWALWNVFPSVIGLLIASRFVDRAVSDDFFNVRGSFYGLTVKTVHFLTISILYFLVLVAQFAGVSKLASALNVPSLAAIIFIVVLVSLYSRGGFTAVTRTDVIQFLIIIALTMILSLFSMFGNQAGPIEPPTTAPMPTSLVIALCLPIMFLPFAQELHQRTAAASPNTSAKSVLLLSALFYGVIGVTLTHYVIVSNSSNLTTMIQTLPPIVGAIALLAVFVALISTIDTSVNIVAHGVGQVAGTTAENTHWFPIIQFLALGIAAIAQVTSPSILSMIVLAMFFYMSGPAATYFGYRYGSQVRFLPIITVFALIFHVMAFFISENAIAISLGVLVVQAGITVLFRKR